MVVIVVAALLLVALLAGVVYLVFVRGRAPTQAPPPAEPTRESADVRPDAAQARPDAARPLDAAAHADTPGARRGSRRTAAVEETPAPRPPDARPPDARRPDTRPPDAPKPDYGKLPPWPKGFKFKPARVVVMHHNRMGRSFVLVELIHQIDGRTVFKRADNSGALDKKRELKTFNGMLRSGQHRLVVRAVYRGGAHGVFSYHKGYRYRILSQYTFTANPARRTLITVKGVEKGGPNTPLKDKPSLKFSHRMVK
jgi:hypothetical protein